MSRKSVQVFVSAARTASPAKVVLSVPPWAENLLVLTDVTAIDLTPSLTTNINGRIPVSGTEWLLLASTAQTTVGSRQIQVGPALTTSANLRAHFSLPPEISIEPVHADADSITYSIQAVFS